MNGKDGACEFAYDLGVVDDRDPRNQQGSCVFVQGSGSESGKFEMFDDGRGFKDGDEIIIDIQG